MYLIQILLENGCEKTLAYLVTWSELGPREKQELTLEECLEIFLVRSGEQMFIHDTDIWEYIKSRATTLEQRQLVWKSIPDNVTCKRLAYDFLHEKIVEIINEETSSLV